MDLGFHWEAILFWLVLADCVGCNAVAWFGLSWYHKHFSFMAKHFPATKGWAGAYLFLVLWIGCLLYRLDVLPI